jgi:hypothetical protein
MGKPKIPAAPEPVQPDAPAARLVQAPEDSPVDAATQKQTLKRYLSAPTSQTQSGVGVQL